MFYKEWDEKRNPAEASACEQARRIEFGVSVLRNLPRQSNQSIAIHYSSNFVTNCIAVPLKYGLFWRCQKTGGR